MLHETAKSAARDGGNVAVVVHVSVQQAFALLDLDWPKDAVMQVRHARREANGRVPAMLRAWLKAAEAEALAAAGQATAARKALDAAARDAVQVRAGEARELAEVTTSARQKKRIIRLLAGADQESAARG